MNLQESITAIELHPSQRVEFRVIEGRGKIKHIIEPKLDRDGNKIGVKRYSQEQINGMSRDEYVLDGDNFVLEQGATLDLTKQADKTKWEWIKAYIPHTIALSKEQTNSANDGCFFYIFIEEVESKKEVDKLNSKMEALKLVYDSGADELRKRAKLLGVNMDNAITEKVREFLMMKADSSPDDVIDVYKNPTMVVKFNMLEAIEKGIVTKDRDSGSYWFGSQLLGASDAMVLNFLATASNRKIYEAIVKQTTKE